MQMTPIDRAGTMPAWVPDCAKVYLTHVGAGVSIRAIAREQGVNASTVLRAVRKVEARRDDPLVDEALRDLSRTLEEHDMSRHDPRHQPTAERESRRVLRRLGESGTVLAVADGMEKAVVVRESDASPTRLAVTGRETAREMALRDWIACDEERGRVRRYRLTATGRAALKRILAAEGGTDAFAAQHREEADCADPGDAARTLRRNMTESPLALLARRREKDGSLFLSAAQVAAGERLREEFELAQMGPRVGQNWDRFITGRDSGALGPSDPVRGPEHARARVAAALRDLGPGLGDVVLRTCCFLEGVEAAERRLGWSARSGKIVLRIALERLRRHYEEQGAAAGMIG